MKILLLSLFLFTSCSGRDTKAPTPNVTPTVTMKKTYAEMNLDDLNTLGNSDIHAVGKLEGQRQEIITYGFGGQYYRKRSIKGDGSCWIRSLIQSILYPVLHDEREFNNFVDNIAKIPARHRSLNENDRKLLELLSEESSSFALALFDKLFKSSDEERHALFNYEKIDNYLDRFFRSVIAMEQIIAGDRAAATSTLNHHGWDDPAVAKLVLTKFFNVGLLVTRQSGTTPELFYSQNGKKFLVIGTFGFLPESIYTHSVVFSGRAHADILERVSIPKESRRDFTISDSCSGLIYLLDDGDVNENDEVNYVMMELGEVKNVSYLHLGALLCNSDLARAFLKMTTAAVTSLINKKDSAGNTPLHYWALAREPGISALEELVRRGADVETKNNKGEFAIDLFHLRDVLAEKAVFDSYKKLLQKTFMTDDELRKLRDKINAQVEELKTAGILTEDEKKRGEELFMIVSVFLP